VYLPPSAYETCFISTAHDADALDRTIAVLTAAIGAL
jgi:glutamate-1-semialdehyde aminotransferase